MRPDKGRRAGAAVEVFVAAAHGKVGIGALEVHGHGTCAVAQIPDAENAFGMGGGRDGCHIVHGTRAVVDMGEHGDRHVGLQRAGDFLGLEQYQLQAVFLTHGLGDIEIGGEVAALADQLFAAGRIFAGNARGSAQHLVEIDGGGVGEHQLALAHAQPGCELVAQALGQRDPARLVPGGNEVLAPFLRHHFGRACGGGLGLGAQGVAVQVDHALGQGKAFAQRAQRVLGVQSLAVLQSGHCLPSLIFDSC